MAKTVRFLTECAGRNKGVVETVGDDTLAASWVDARLAEYVPTPPQPDPPKQDAPVKPPVDRAPKRPPVDRMARKAPRTK